jgi:hypothetical protein
MTFVFIIESNYNEIIHVHGYLITLTHLNILDISREPQNHKTNKQKPLTPITLL